MHINKHHRVVYCLDLLNIATWFKDNGKQPNYKAIQEECVCGRILVTSSVFGPEDANLVELYDHLQHDLQTDIYTKKYKQNNGDRYVCDWDVGMGGYIASAVRDRQLDSVIVVSGDKDFADIRPFLLPGIKLEIAAPYPNTSKEYLRLIDRYIDIGDNRFCL